MAFVGLCKVKEIYELYLQLHEAECASGINAKDLLDFARRTVALGL